MNYANIMFPFVSATAPSGNPYKLIYFAGALFSYQQIVGNVKLVEAIEQRSNGRYKFILPQRLEQSDHNSAKAIRDQDLNQVFKSDGLLVNFNGSDLDDGTIAEFMIAQSVGKKSVVLRTDFRQFTDELSVNPMLLNYPGTEYLDIDALGLSKKLDNNIEETTALIADRIIVSLDKLFAAPDVLSNSDQQTATRLVRQSIGLPPEM